MYYWWESAFWLIKIIIFIVLAYYFFSRIKKLEKKQNKIIEILSKNNLDNSLRKNFEKNNNKKFVVGDDEILEEVHRNVTASESSVEKKNVFVKENIKKNKDKKTEFNVGSKVIPAIGILSILFGMGFLMKYAIDNNLIGRVGRIIIGFLTGIIFIILAERFRKKFPWYSALLAGGAFALLYLTAKFGEIYGLYNNHMALVIMAVITFAAIFISNIINSKIVAFVALAGGFLAPFITLEIVNIGDRVWVLFAYFTMILFGMLFLAYKRQWMSIIYLTAIGVFTTYTIVVLQYIQYTIDEGRGDTLFNFGAYISFITLAFVVFTVAPFAYLLFKKKKVSIKNDNNNSFNKKFVGNENKMLTGYLPWIFTVVVGASYVYLAYTLFFFKFRGYEFIIDPKIIIGFLAAIVYIVLAKISLKRQREMQENMKDDENQENLNKNYFDFKKPVYVFVALASFAIATIPALQFTEGVWTTLAWLMEALVLVYLGVKIKNKVFSYVSFAVLSVAILRLVSYNSYIKLWEWVGDERVSVYSPIVNERFFIYIVAIVVTFITAITVMKMKNFKSIIPKILGFVGNLLFLILIWLEVSDAANTNYLSDEMGSIVISILYLIYASALSYVGVVRKYMSFRVISILIFIFVVAKTYIFDIWYLGQLSRIVMFIVLGIVTLAVGYFYNKNKDKIMEFIKGE